MTARITGPTNRPSRPNASRPPITPSQDQQQRQVGAPLDQDRPQEVVHRQRNHGEDRHEDDPATVAPVQNSQIDRRDQPPGRGRAGPRTAAARWRSAAPPAARRSRAKPMPTTTVWAIAVTTTPSATLRIALAGQHDHFLAARRRPAAGRTARTTPPPPRRGHRGWRRTTIVSMRWSEGAAEAAGGADEPLRHGADIGPHPVARRRRRSLCARRSPARRPGLRRPAGCRPPSRAPAAGGSWAPRRRRRRSGRSATPRRRSRPTTAPARPARSTSVITVTASARRPPSAACTLQHERPGGDHQRGRPHHGGEEGPHHQERSRRSARR